MARRKLSQMNIRKLTRVGGGKSFCITIPISFIRKLKWRERQKLVVKLRGSKITIEDWPASK